MTLIHNDKDKKMNDSPIQFGDRVRVVVSPLTESSGVAGRVGTVFGQTVPSMSQAVSRDEIIGSTENDYAINVQFIEPEANLWFSEDLLELVDHDPGAEIILDGLNKMFIRNELGDWEERAT